MKISFWSVFCWTQRSITQRRVKTPGPIFKKKVLNRAQGLKEKSHEVSARKNNNRLRCNKKCRGGADSAPPPALLGLNAFHKMKMKISQMKVDFDLYLTFTEGGSKHNRTISVEVDISKSSVLTMPIQVWISCGEQFVSPGCKYIYTVIILFLS